MKELTVISGKGGTGKTTFAAAFASLERDAVIADCDVDASNLHLVLDPEIYETQEFSGLKVAIKDDEKCTQCGECLEHCRFDAITEDFTIMPERCEGCGVCEYVCPEDAIRLVDRRSGYAYLSRTRFGPMSHAKLNTAEEASGKLVAVVRDNAKKLANESGSELILIDGPPGTGCPVIAAIAGVNLVLIVTEPSISGKMDLERILGVASHFSIPAIVCVNKFDINTDNTRDIEAYCKEQGAEVVGKLPYNNITTEAMIQRKTVIEYSDGSFSQEVEKMWKRVKEALA